MTGVETRMTDHPANDVNASWSADGSTLAFQSDRTGNYEIYSLDVATGEGDTGDNRLNPRRRSALLAGWRAYRIPRHDRRAQRRLCHGCRWFTSDADYRSGRQREQFRMVAGWHADRLSVRSRR
ncbi:MAG: hypothetical protein HND48_18565 [Chloroflexi bacterium]|nr:hypothetical protein [Chloroflexota bacterium]